MSLIDNKDYVVLNLSKDNMVISPLDTKNNEIYPEYLFIETKAKMEDTEDLLSIGKSPLQMTLTQTGVLKVKPN
jgi:hypothetical protein